MENFEQLEQEENVLQESSPKKRYLLAGVALTVIIVGGFAWYLIQNRIFFQHPEVIDPDVQEVTNVRIIDEEATQSQSLVDTSSWMLHTHEVLGYSIRLSEEFQKIEEIQDGLSFTTKNIQEENNATINVVVFPIWYIIELSEVDQESIEWLKTAKIGDSLGDSIVTSKPNIDGCSGVQVEKSSSGVVGEIKTFCFTDDSFMISNLTGDIQEYEFYYDAAISTFRFGNSSLK